MFDFWKMAYEYKWATPQDMHDIVITKQNPFGYITPEEYEKITGKKFEE